MSSCIFCKIVDGDIPSTKVYEDEHVCAFLDINPQAAKHIIVIPKEHMANILECADREDGLAGHMLRAVAAIAREQKLSEGGFRVVTNCGPNAMQSVEHFHIHMLGGSRLSATMG